MHLLLEKYAQVQFAKLYADLQVKGDIGTACALQGIPCHLVIVSISRGRGAG